MRIGSDAGSSRIYGPDLVMRARPTPKNGEASRDERDKISARERQVLARERTLKARVPGGRAHTTYTYATGPDGRRYIVGAEVSIIAPEDELAAATGGTGRPAGARVAVKQDEGEAGEKNVSEPKEGAKSAERAEQDPETATLIAKLKQTEREVVAHEAAHMAVGGRFAGSASYTYTAGPDGKRYITGGEVPISTPATDDPEEALRNAEQVARAAMAPANPSGQDIAVAAGAAQMAAQARTRIAARSADAGEGDAGATETRTPDAHRSAQIKRAYETTRSPKGLWTESGGFRAEGPRPASRL